MISVVMRTIGPSLQSLGLQKKKFSFSVSSQVKRSLSEPGRTVRKTDITEALADVFIGRAEARQVWCQALSCLTLRSDVGHIYSGMSVGHVRLHLVHL